jgi:hypothetical protein
MHPALEQGKLIPVVARSAYKKHLTWPFGTIHARCLVEQRSFDIETVKSAARRDNAAVRQRR